MKRIIFVSIAILFFSQITAYSADVSLMGITLGKSLKDINLPECKIATEKYVIVYESDQDQVCWMDEEKHQRPGLYKVLEIYTLNHLSFPTKTFARTKSNETPVDQIIIQFAPNAAEEMLKLIQGKYGKPNIINRSIIQNRMGAKFDRLFAVWNIDGHEIILDSRDRINRAKLEATYKTIAEQKKKEREDRRKMDKDKI